MCAYVLRPGLAGKRVRADGRVAADLAQPNPLGGARKRALDLVGASIALILLSPLMLFVAGLVRIVFGGPAIIAERRVGFGGKTYECYKFRSDVSNVDVLHRHQEHKPTASCFGNVLISSSLDELPQLLNVLRGDMSLVGPSSVLPDDLARYGRHTRTYLRAKPGLTGMWQAHGRDRRTCAGRIACDQYYVRQLVGGT